MRDDRERERELQLRETPFISHLQESVNLNEIVTSLPLAVTIASRAPLLWKQGGRNSRSGCAHVHYMHTHSLSQLMETFPLTI